MTRKGSQVRVLYGPPKKVLVSDASDDRDPPGRAAATGECGDDNSNGSTPETGPRQFVSMPGATGHGVVGRAPGHLRLVGSRGPERILLIPHF